MSVWTGKEIWRLWRKSLLFKELPVPRTWWSDRWPGDRCAAGFCKGTTECWPLYHSSYRQLDAGTEQIHEWKNGKERKTWTESYLSSTQGGPEHPWTLPTRGRGLAILQWALVFSDKEVCDTATEIDRGWDMVLRVFLSHPTLLFSEWLQGH